MAPNRTSPVAAVNATAGVIPRYAVVEPTGGVDADGRVQVGKATRANGVAVLFNGPVPVAAGAAFDALPPTPAAVAGVSTGDGGADPGDLPLAAGATLGTKVGDWFLRAAQTGFRAVAPPTLGAVQVVLDGTGGGGAAAGVFVKLTAQGTTADAVKFAFAQWAVNATGPVVVPGGIAGTVAAGYARDIGGISYAGLVGTYQYATPNPLAPGTWLFDAKLCSTFEAVTAESISNCDITITYTTFQILPQPKATVALSTRTTTISVPSVCQTVLTDVTVTMSCVANAPVATVTKTFAKVSVLACGVVCP